RRQLALRQPALLAQAGAATIADVGWRRQPWRHEARCHVGRRLASEWPVTGELPCRRRANQRDGRGRRTPPRPDLPVLARQHSAESTGGRNAITVRRQLTG